MGIYNSDCITGICASILDILGLDVPNDITLPIEALKKIGKCDRVFMYNPDAIGQWVYEQHREDFEGVEKRANLKLPMLSVMPSVTPACFGSMYSGLLPKIHGILKYEKPVLKVRTLFDYLPAEGKKVAIVSTENDSISMIFLERNIDYFIYRTKEECNAKAKELIEKDCYDCIVLYNGDYDHWMHRFSPEGRPALKALKENTATYCEICDLIEEKWRNHRTAVAFAPDHGCHRVFGIFGSHGIDSPCDMNIVHFWSVIGKESL